MKFVDFCCNDIVPKSQFDFLERLNPQPRKGNKPFSTFYNHYTTNPDFSQVTKFDVQYAQKSEARGAYFWKATILTKAKNCATMVSRQEITAGFPDKLRKEDLELAKRRMFTAEVVETDAFCSLPASAQSLYVHLCMNADDDGFVDKWKSILRYLRVKKLMMECLINAGFILKFPDDVLLISDWNRHNRVRQDRYTKGPHKELLDTLHVLPNGRYINAFGDFLATQYR